MKTKIIVTEEDGELVGEYFLQQGEHLIGRTADCSIKLKSDHVSREHARLIIGSDILEIEDLDSSWGTFLDDVQIKSRTSIKPTQKLRISDLNFDIESESLAKMGPVKVEDLPKSMLIPDGGVVVEDSKIEEEAPEAEDTAEPDKELELDHIAKTEKIPAGKNNEQFTKNIGITVAGVLVLGFLLWSFVFRTTTAEPRSKDEIMRQIATLPALFLTEKTQRQVTAPEDPKNFVDKVTGEICWRARACHNSDCPGKGNDGKPHLFISPNPAVFLKADGTFGFDLEKANKAGNYSTIGACPECLKKRNLSTESGATQKKYIDWVKPHTLPESEKRKKELLLEHATATN